MSYSRGTRTTTTEDENQPSAVERRALRNIYGPFYDSASFGLKEEQTNV